jgi:invasion protein IalB
MNWLDRRFGAFVVAAGVALGANAAAAQTAKPAPAAPAAPAAAAAPAQPQGPVKLDLVGMQPQWTKLCGKDQGTGKEVCLVTRDFGQSSDRSPSLAFALYSMAGDDKHFLRMILPLGMLLKPGFRLIIDKGEPIEGRYSFCMPNGCSAEAELNNANTATLRKAQTLSVVMRNPVNLEVTFNVPMKDFATAMDGPAADPKVLEQQSQEMQKQLEEKAQKERELLEQQSGIASPAAPAAPAAPAK